jgi:hypothetical protein
VKAKGECASLPWPSGTANTYAELLADVLRSGDEWAGVACCVALDDLLILFNAKEMPGNGKGRRLRDGRVFKDIP